MLEPVLEWQEVTTIVFRLKLTSSFFHIKITKETNITYRYSFLWRRRLGHSIISSRRVILLEVGGVEGLGGALAATVNGFHGHEDVRVDQLGDSSVKTRERHQDSLVIYLLAFIVHIWDTGGHHVDADVFVVLLDH